VDEVSFAGADTASPAPGTVEALAEADAILIAPSNPYVSIAPILAVGGLRRAVEERAVPCVAVSPLVGGRAVKGPADRMLSRMAGGTAPSHVADRYAGLLDALVIDHADAPAEAGVMLLVTSTLMSDAAASAALARTVLESLP